MLTLLFLIAFPFALWNAWKNVQLAKASTAWPTTPGTVTAAERGRVMFRPQPRVAYSYSVNGVSYTGKRISFAAGVPGKETDSVLARYPVGRAVAVSYAPEKPSEAALEPGSNRNVTAQFRTLVVCFIIIALANVLLYYMRALEAA